MIRSDGTIEFESPKISLMQGMTLNDFLASPLMAFSKPENQNAPWSRYDFQPVTLAGEQFAGYVNFCSGALYTIGLWVLRPEFEIEILGKTLPIEHEQERHLFHKQFLLRMLGEPSHQYTPPGFDERDANIQYIFSWGAVMAATDTKSGGCDISITYSGTPRFA